MANEATETDEAFKVIRTQLLANGTFAALMPRVYASDQVPQTPTFPYCLIDFAAGSDMDGAGTHRIMNQSLMLVRMVNKGPVDNTMREANKAMDNVLQTVVSVVSNGYVFSARRERPYRRGYQDAANNKFNETGGFYRFYVA